MKRKAFGIAIIFSLAFTLLTILPINRAKAEEVSAIAIGMIDYDNLTIQVYTGGNSLVYYSIDRSNWTEVEGEYIDSAKVYIMDISWIASNKDVTLYFKGDINKTVKSVTLPEMNSSLKVTYNKATNSFTFLNDDDALAFEWRKATDYNWIRVDMNEYSATYRNFLSEIDKLRVKGAKINIRIPQQMGYGVNDPGKRPSKEVAITIPAMENAPAIKVNSSKLTLNTSAAMEYYNPFTLQWEKCSANMSIEALAPLALYKNGSNQVTVMIRKAATGSKPYSKTAYVIVPGQAAAPTIGDISKDVTYYYMNNKLTLVFNKATANDKYEYTYVKPGAVFDITKASWKTVSSSKPISLSNKTVPDGSIVYVRKKGVDANSSKKTDVILASEVNSFVVKY